MPNVVKTDRPHLGFGPKLAAVFRTTTQGRVRRVLEVSAALLAADVPPPRGYAGPTKGAAQDTSSPTSRRIIEPSSAGKT